MPPPRTDAPPTVTTPVSVVSLLPGMVLNWRYKPGVRLSLEEAKHESSLIGRLMEDHSLTECRLLIDIREMGSISRDARRFFASQEVHDTYGVRGLALVVGSPVSTMIGNLYLSFNHTLHPTRLFTKREEAIAWLLVL